MMKHNGLRRAAAALATLIALLSLVVYYSKEELTVRAWWTRTVLHLLLLEAVLLPLAHC